MEKQILKNERGLSTLAAAIATIFLLGIGISLMMTDISNSSQIRNKMRVSMQSYTIMEQLALRFGNAFQLRNPPWFIEPVCPLLPVATVDMGPAPGGRYCSYPAQACPAGTTLRTITGVNGFGLPTFGVCLTNDLDGNASPDDCVRTATGANYCVDVNALFSSIDFDSDGTSIPTLEVPLIDKTPWSVKVKSNAIALFENSIQMIAPYLDPMESAQAQIGAENLLTARPNAPPLAATNNLVSVPACVDAVGGGAAAGLSCVRCADPDTFCVQIKLCLPPGCAGGAARTLYQRIAILRLRPQI
ncbi:MAG: hypothetical protein IPL83_14885 [Bdellovibrionales bacterium]|nr:hypothetical protein [Bdellovibrionales bacterium]